MKNLSVQSLILTTCLFLLGSMSNNIVDLTKAAPTDLSGESFASFLSQFPHVKLPYGVEFSDFKTYELYQNGGQNKFTYHERQAEARKHALKRTRFIPEIARGHFGRIGPPTVTPVARYYPDEQSIVIIYRNAPNFRDEFTEFYQMIRYNLNGKIIPFQQDGYEKESIVIGQTLQDEAITFRIDPNGNIWQNIYELSWDQKKVSNHQTSLQFKEAKITATQLLQFNKQGVVTVKKEDAEKDRV